MKKLTTNMLLFLATILLTSTGGSGQQCCTAPGYVSVDHHNYDVAAAFEEYEIVPDYIPVPPSDFLVAEFFSAEVDLGNYVSALRALSPSVISYPYAKENELYTLALIDVDYPSRKNPDLRGLIQLLTVNNKGKNLMSGDAVVPFYPATPYLGTGLHRYIALVYEQKDAIDADDTNLLRTTRNRANFSIVDFAETYSLGDPKAGNFFQSGVEDCELA